MSRALCFTTLLVCLAGFGLSSFAADKAAGQDADHGGVEPPAGTADHGGAGSHNGEHGAVGDQDAAHDAEIEHDGEFGAEHHAGDAHAEPHGDHAEGHGSHGNTNPLSVDPDLVIFTFLAFGLTYLVMSKFAWKPICAALDKREAWMASQLDAAQRRNEESKRLREEHASQLSGATDQVRALMDQARRDADREKQSILEAAQSAAAAEKQQALDAIGAARGDALDDLAGRSVDTAINLAGRIVGRPLNRDDHSGLIDETVRQFKSPEE